MGEEDSIVRFGRHPSLCTLPATSVTTVRNVIAASIAYSVSGKRRHDILVNPTCNSLGRASHVRKERLKVHEHPRTHLVSTRTAYGGGL